MNQRPSRHLIARLAEQFEKLEAKGIVVIGIQAEIVEEKTMKEWVKRNAVPFSIGMIQIDGEETRFQWGVKSLPWLILTDKRHIVRAEGLGLDELDLKIAKNKKAK